MTIAELIEKLQNPDFDQDWDDTVCMDGFRAFLDRVDWDYRRESNEIVIELWAVDSVD